MPGGGQPQSRDARIMSAYVATNDPRWRSMLVDYAAGCETVQQIADRIGVGRSTLLRWLRDEPAIKERLNLRQGYRPGDRRPVAHTRPRKPR